MYYIGTKKDCESYNTEVTTKEVYSGTTAKWADVTKHPTKNEYAIIAHSKYSSELTSVNELPSDWFNIKD